MYKTHKGCVLTSKLNIFVKKDKLPKAFASSPALFPEILHMFFIVLYPTV